MREPVLQHPVPIDIESLPVACFIIKSDGIIKNVNQTGLQLLMKPRGHLLNKVFAQHILKQDEPLFKMTRMNVTGNAYAQSCNVRLFRSDGELLDVRLNLSLNSSAEDEIVMIITDITYHKKIEDTQSFLLGNSWTDKGVSFFNAVAEYLSSSLNADFVCIDRLRENGLAETVTVFFDGEIRENIVYALADTPCENLMPGQIKIYPSSVRVLFPKDEFLMTINAESYAGITLTGTDGKAIGLIGVIGRKPISDSKVVNMILRQVSIRVASELQQKLMKEEIEAAHQKKAETLQRLNNILSALNKSSQAMISTDNEQELMEKVCQIIVEDCGYALMWIGKVNQDEGKTITPVASAGFEEGYLETANITYADEPRGRGPTGTCIRTGQYSVCQDVLNEKMFAPWRDQAIKRGYNSSMAIPLKYNEKVFGMIALYAASVNFFTEDEIRLMTRLADDLSNGITQIRLRNKYNQSNQNI